MAALIKKIKELMGSLDRDTVARACRRLQFRIEVVITSDGDFIEIIHSCYIPLLSFFYFNKIGSFSAAMCYLEEKEKKIIKCIYIFIIRGIF